MELQGIPIGGQFRFKGDPRTWQVIERRTLETKIAPVNKFFPAGAYWEVSRRMTRPIREQRPVLAISYNSFDEE